MRTFTTTHTVYKFEELSDEAKESAVQTLWDINVDYEWWEYTLDYWKEKLAAIGFIDSKVYFSGFSSQGDGACFDAKIDLACLANYMFYQATDYVDARMWRSIYWANENGQLEGPSIYTVNTFYSHESTRSVSVNGVYLNDCEVTDDIVDALDDIDDLRYRLCKQIYRELESEYWDLTSEERVIERITDSDYEFYEDGRLA